MSITGALVLLAALVAHGIGLVLLVRGALWLGRQRRLGYPDPRARAVDRPRYLTAIVGAYLWANMVILVGVAVIASRV